MDHKTMNTIINPDQILDDFINKIRQSLKLFITTKVQMDGFYSLVLLARDNDSDINSKYTLMISSKVLDKQNESSTITNLFEFLKKNMSNKFFRKISKIYLFKTEDKIVKAVNSALNVTNGKVFLNNSSVNGITFIDSVVLESQKPV